MKIMNAGDRLLEPHAGSATSNRPWVSATDHRIKPDGRN